MISNNVSRGKIFFVHVVLLLSGLSSRAQTTDFGGILQAEYENNFTGNYDIFVKEDLRFDHDILKYSRSKTALGIDYRFVR